jgi:hypothetical protein
MAGVATSAVMAAVAASRILLAVIIDPLVNDLILTNIAGIACSSGDILATSSNGKRIIVNDALTSCSFGRGLSAEARTAGKSSSISICRREIFSLWTRAEHPPLCIAAAFRRFE